MRATLETGDGVSEMEATICDRSAKCRGARSGGYFKTPALASKCAAQQKHHPRRRECHKRRRREGDWRAAKNHNGRGGVSLRLEIIYEEDRIYFGIVISLVATRIWPVWIGPSPVHAAEPDAPESDDSESVKSDPNESVKSKQSGEPQIDQHQSDYQKQETE